MKNSKQDLVPLNVSVKQVVKKLKKAQRKLFMVGHEKTALVDDAAAAGQQYEIAHEHINDAIDHLNILTRMIS